VSAASDDAVAVAQAVFYLVDTVAHPTAIREQFPTSAQNHPCVASINERITARLGFQRSATGTPDLDTEPDRDSFDASSSSVGPDAASLRRGQLERNTSEDSEQASDGMARSAVLEGRAATDVVLNASFDSQLSERRRIIRHPSVTAAGLHAQVQTSAVQNHLRVDDKRNPAAAVSDGRGALAVTSSSADQTQHAAAGISAKPCSCGCSSSVGMPVTVPRSYDGSFDLILGADVLFFESFHDDLLHAIYTLLKHQGPVALPLPLTPSALTAKDPAPYLASDSLDAALVSGFISNPRVQPQAWLLAPRRGGSLQRFVDKAGRFRVRVPGSAPASDQPASPAFAKRPLPATASPRSPSWAAVAAARSSANKGAETMGMVSNTDSPTIASRSVQQFHELQPFEVTVFERYNDSIWKNHQSLLAGNAEAYHPDTHYPLFVVLRLKP
jgi:hypothetical protein